MRPSGLFAGAGASPMSSIADHSWRNAQLVAQMTGQKYTAAYSDGVLRTPGALFDSTYTTRAIEAAGEIDPSLEPQMLHALQHAHGTSSASEHVPWLKPSPRSPPRVLMNLSISLQTKRRSPAGWSKMKILPDRTGRRMGEQRWSECVASPPRVLPVVLVTIRMVIAARSGMVRICMAARPSFCKPSNARARPRTCRGDRSTCRLRRLKTAIPLIWRLTMKIALIGASGNVGSRVAAELSYRGHSVTGIARDASKIAKLPGVTPVTQDITDTKALAEVLKGHDVVISSVHFLDSNPDQLIAAVKTAGVRRYLVVGGAGSLEVAPGVRLIDSPDFPAEYKPETAAGCVFLDRLRQEKELEWTFLSPSLPSFSPGKRTVKSSVSGPTAC